MNTQQGAVVEVLVAQPKCICCDQPAFGENVVDTGQLCLKHTEIRIFVWRLKKRGDAANLGNLMELMRQGPNRPVSFSLSEAPGLWEQYQVYLKQQEDAQNGQTEAA